MSWSWIGPCTVCLCVRQWTTINFGLILRFLFWRKDEKTPLYYNLYFQSMMDNFVQSDWATTKFFHCMFDVFFICESMTDCNNQQRTLITPFLLKEQDTYESYLSDMRVYKSSTFSNSCLYTSISIHTQVYTYICMNFTSKRYSYGPTQLFPFIYGNEFVSFCCWEVILHLHYKQIYTE